jgi:hypothetical protein
MVGQNGLASNTEPKLQTGCGNQKKRHKRHLQRAKEVR